MPEIYLVSEYRPECHGAGRAEERWPDFSDGHLLVAWYAQQARKTEYTLDYRNAVTTLIRYLRKHREIDFNDDCWCKFLALRNKKDATVWCFREFKPLHVRWHSRTNDLVLTSLLETHYFGEAYSYSRKALLNAAGLPATVKWLVGKPDLRIDLAPRWRDFLSLVTAWPLDQLQYWQRIDKEYDGSAGCAAMCCTYHLLDPGFRDSFLKQATPRLSLTSDGRQFLFAVYTARGLWQPEDWQPRKVEANRSFYSHKQCNGLEWVSSPDWRMAMSNPRKVSRLVAALPDFAQYCLLKDALEHPKAWSGVPLWRELTRLPVGDRETLFRKYQDNISPLWAIYESLFNEEGTSEVLAVRALRELIPEHEETWARAAPLNLNARELLDYLELTRNIPVGNPEHTEAPALPTDFTF